MVDLDVPMCFIPRKVRPRPNAKPRMPTMASHPSSAGDTDTRASNWNIRETTSDSSQPNIKEITVPVRGLMPWRPMPPKTRPMPKPAAARIASMTPVVSVPSNLYVAGHDREVLPNSDWPFRSPGAAPCSAIITPFCFRRPPGDHRGASRPEDEDFLRERGIADRLDDSTKPRVKSAGILTAEELGFSIALPMPRGNRCISIVGGWMGGKTLGVFSAIIIVVAFLLVRNMLNVESSAPEIAVAPEAPPAPSVMEPSGPPPNLAPEPVPPDESVLLWLRPVVVQVKTDVQRGSGILIDAAGNVVTNNHVVEGSSGLAVVFEDGREVTAEVWATDKSLDLAILRIAGATPVSEVWGASSDVQVGDEIMTLGFPRELGGSVTVTNGTVSALRPPFLQTDVAMDPGNSGGPLVNMQGKVIGITAWKAAAAGDDPSDGIAFAIPANEITRRLNGQIAWPLQTLIPVTDPPSVAQISREQIGAGASLVLDDSNNAHAVWSEKVGEDFQIKYSFRGPKGFWAMPRNISNSPVWAGAPSAVVDAAGTVHVAWHEYHSANADSYDVFYARRRADEEWSAPADISQTGGLSRDPVLTGDSHGTLHIVWGEGPPGDRSIVYSQRPARGFWSRHFRIPGTGEATDNKGLVIDREGTVFLAWNDGDQVFLSLKPEGENWGSPEPVSVPSMQSLSQDIAIDRRDVVHVAWEVWKDGAARILYRQRRVDGGWSSSLFLSGTERSASGAKLAVDPNGRLHTLWLRDPGPEEETPSLMLSCQPLGGSNSISGVVHEGHVSSLQTIAVDGSEVIHALVSGAVGDRGDPSIRYVIVPALCG